MVARREAAPGHLSALCSSGPLIGIERGGMEKAGRPIRGLERSPC
jgi:hypothetical protein